jgi:hypothetical protein
LEYHPQRLERDEKGEWYISWTWNFVRDALGMSGLKERAVGAIGEESLREPRHGEGRLD